MSSNEKHGILKWLLQETCEPENLQSKSLLDEDPRGGLTVLVEVGPRMSFTTAYGRQMLYRFAKLVI